MTLCMYPYMNLYLWKSAVLSVLRVISFTQNKIFEVRIIIYIEKSRVSKKLSNLTNQVMLPVGNGAWN